MPRKYVRKSDKQMDRTDLEAAFKHRVATSCSLKEAADRFNIKKTTLADAFYLSKKLSDGVTYMAVASRSNRVFSPQQEIYIADYTIHAAKMFYGLPMNDVRRMVYQYAIACGSKSIPAAWEKEKMATRDWYYAFMNRHPNLVLKAPEGMSIARIVAFNKVNVETFFKAYTLALEKYTFTPDRIYNLDESSLSTVMKPVKVVCARGQPVATQVCERHFTEDDFRREALATDSLTGRTVTAPLKKAVLHPWAVPSILPNCPSYLSTHKHSRPTPDSRRKRRDKIAKRKALLESVADEDQYRRERKFHNVDELEQETKFIDETYWTVIRKHDSLWINRVVESPYPSILFSVVVKPTCAVQVFLKDAEMHKLGNYRIPSIIDDTNNLDELLQNVRQFDSETMQLIHAVQPL